MHTAVTWLASSSFEIDRARAILKSLDKPDTVDELGFQEMSRAISNHFYPAVTTLLTRARYLFFIADIYRKLELDKFKKQSDVKTKARKMQDELRKRLDKGGEKDGVIGRSAEKDLIRYPSTLYWSALLTLGIRREDRTESSYQEAIAAGEYRPHDMKDDDGLTHPVDVHSMWDPDALRIHSQAKGETDETFALSFAEAEYLEKKYAALGQTHGAEPLIAHLVKLSRDQKLRSPIEFANLWDISPLPKSVKEDARHAKMLSLLAKGATLQYHCMLIVLKKEKDLGAREAFKKWWGEAKKQGLRSWIKGNDFSTRLKAWGVPSPASDHKFLWEWTDVITGAKSASAALADEKARSFIKSREASVRPTKKRLSGGHHLNSWQMRDTYDSQNLFLLDYRHPEGRQFAEDIAKSIANSIPKQLRRQAP